MTENAIPKELKNDPSWVVVKNSSKVPFNCTNNKWASPSDKSTWTDYKSCLNAVYSGKYDGLGYCFHDNGLVAIDIDDGFDEDGFMSDLAVDIITHCQSYTEISRSGRGMHIILKGTLPFNGGNNRHGVEIYKTGRYFIITGRKIIYDTIESNQEAIDYVVNKYFDSIPKVGNGTKKPVMYAPTVAFVGGKITTQFPPIAEGCRNACLTSYAGQLHCKGATPEMIFTKLKDVNSIACVIPLEEYELKSIVKSVTRYTR